MSAFVKDHLESIEKNKVMSFILTTGEEVIATVIENKDDYVVLRKPRKLMVHMEVDPQSGEQFMKMGLTHLFNTDQDELFNVPMRHSMIGSVVIPADGASRGYEAQTSSIQLAQ